MLYPFGGKEATEVRWILGTTLYIDEDVKSALDISKPSK